MVTKKELHNKRQKRMMLRGFVGTGKTYTLTNLAKRYMKERKRVLYIDFKDRGAVPELEKIAEELLTLLDYETPGSYIELVKVPIHKDTKLIIVDALHHLRFASRQYIRGEFVKQGYYTIGWKTNRIEDENTFDLGSLGYGFGYNVANIRANDFVDRLMNSDMDIAVSIIPEPKGDKPTFTDTLSANFDNIIDLTFRDNEEGKRGWFYHLYRWRGIETNDYGDQPNNSSQDPFAAIEATGGKPIKDYVVHYVENNQPERIFLKGVDAEDVTAQLMAKHQDAKEVIATE